MSGSINELVEFLARHRGAEKAARALLVRASVNVTSFNLHGSPRDMWTNVMHELTHVRAPEELASFLARVRVELPRAPGPDGPSDARTAASASSESAEPKPETRDEAKAVANSESDGEPKADADTKSETEEAEPEPEANEAPDHGDEPDNGGPGSRHGLVAGVSGVALILISIAIQLSASCLPASADLSVKTLVALGAGLLGGALTGRMKVAITPTAGQMPGPLAGWKVDAVGGSAVALVVGVATFYLSSPDPRCEKTPDNAENQPAGPERASTRPDPAHDPTTTKLSQAALSVPEPPKGMRRVRGGTFVRGSSQTEWKDAYRACRALERLSWDPEDCSEQTWTREQRIHDQAQIDAFFLDINEVSVRQLGSWLRGSVGRGELAVEGQLILDAKGNVVAQLGTTAADGHPAVSQWQLDAEGKLEVVPGRGEFPAALVSWQLTDAYCRSRAARLASEAEWEWAARGTDRSNSYPWGKKRGCSEIVVDRVADGQCKDEHHGPAHVGAGAADESWAMIRDLGGGVSEWVNDQYLDETTVREGVDRCVEAGTLAEHEVGVRSCHLFKGGSWAWPRIFARSAGRSVGDSTPTSAALFDTRQILFDDVGFRCAQDLPPSNEEP